MSTLEIRDLHVSVDTEAGAKEILKREVPLEGGRAAWKPK